MASEHERGLQGPKQLEKQLLDAAENVAKVWLDTSGMTGHQRLDDALKRLAEAYREWEGSH